MTYPPTIAADAFRPVTPAPRSVVAQCPLQQQCAITALWLHPRQQRDPHFAPHDGALAGDAPSRYRFAPGLANADEVRFAVTNPALVRTATLEVYARSAEPALPTWTRALDAQALRDGRYRLTDLFGQGAWPTVVKAPYRLDLRIVAGEGATAVVPSAWIYLDVVAKGVVFSFGAGPAARDRDVILGVAPACLNDPAAYGRLLLKSNRFATSNAELTQVSDGGTMQWSGIDHIFTQHQAAWGAGPELPVLARLTVEDSAGQAVASPLGTAGAVLVWDALDAVADAPDPLANATDANTIRAYLNRYLASGAQGRNCPTAHGGKRESVSPMLAGRLANASNPGNFVTGACERRAGSLFSTVLPGGDAGVYFLPSRMAGDAYRLRAEFRYDPAGDGAPALDALQPPEATVSGRTGVLQVWRRVDLVERRSLDAAARALALQQLRDAVTALRTRRRQFLWESDDDIGSQTAIWDNLATTDDVRDAWPNLDPPAREVTAAKVRVAQNLAVWSGELAAIRRRLDRAFVHVEAADPLPYAAFAGYHAAVRQAAQQESAVVNEALDLSNAWAAGEHAVEFVSAETFFQRRTQTLGGAPAALQWAEAYFGVASAKADGQCALTHGTLIAQHQLDAPAFKNVYLESCRLWAKKLLAAALNAGVGAAEGVYVAAFSALYRIGNHDEAPMAYAQPLAGHQGVKTAYVVFPRADETTAAHELGHCLFLAHAPGGNVGNADPYGHDAAMANCLMGYHDTATDFCGFCLLRLRGWDRVPLRPTF